MNVLNLIEENELWCKCVEGYYFVPSYELCEDLRLRKSFVLLFNPSKNKFYLDYNLGELMCSINKADSYNKALELYWADFTNSIIPKSKKKYLNKDWLNKYLIKEK